VKDVISQCL